MTTRAYIVAVVLLASATGWAEGASRAPETQPGPAYAATQPIGESLERRAFRAAVTWEYAPDVLAAADDWGLDVFLLLALLWAESRLDVTAVNKRSGAIGVAQFTSTGRRGLERIRSLRGERAPFTRADALDPRKAIPAAAEFLSWLTARWGERGGVRWYNGGRHRRAFESRVYRRMEHYRREAGLPPREEAMGKGKKRHQPLNVTKQVVRDLNTLGGLHPTRALHRDFSVCHQCGGDADGCGCWERATEYAPRRGVARPATASGG